MQLKTYAITRAGPKAVEPDSSNENSLAVNSVFPRVAMCERHPGSKVVICTDGIANTGVGSMDDSTVNIQEQQGFFPN